MAEGEMRRSIAWVAQINRQMNRGSQLLRVGLLLAILFLPLARIGEAATIVYLATDQVGAQTQIDVLHTSSWSFSPTTPISLAGGIFDLKDGSSTTADITFSLYRGTDATGTLLGQVTLSITTFCAQVSKCGTFDYHDFFFTTPIALTTGVNYFATLTSQASPNQQSAAYFIKQQSFFGSDQSATPIVPNPLGPPLTGTPEPGSITLTISGLAAGWGLVRRRRRRTVNLRSRTA